MNLVINIFGVALLASFVCQLLKSKWPELASVLNIATAIVILLAVFSSLAYIIGFITDLSESIEIDDGYIKKILNAMAISLLVKLLTSFLKDMNNSALAFAAEFGGRICILAIILPIIIDAINALLELIG